MSIAGWEVVLAQVRRQEVGETKQLPVFFTAALLQLLPQVTDVSALLRLFMCVLELDCGHFTDEVSGR